jgi:hypothetical protein
LEGFANQGTMTGEELRDSVLRIHPSISVATFYSSLEEAARRDLVSRSIIMQNGRPKLVWKCLVL